MKPIVPRVSIRTPVLILMACTLAGRVAAQELSYTVQIESPRVQVGQRFVISCQVQAPGDIDNIELPDLGGLTELGRTRSEGSQVTVVNGQLSMTRTMQINLTAVAQKPGTYTIGAGQVRAGGSVASSRPVRLSAIGSAAAPTRSPAGAPPSSAAQPTTALPHSRGPHESIFVALSVDRDQVYLGQQITATLTLYSRVDLSDVRSIQLPSLAGVVTEEIASPRQIRGRRRVLGGRAYQAYLIKRLALFPTRSGLLQIPSASLSAVVGGGFFNSGRLTELHSDPVEVDVKPLPAEGRPAGFEPSNVGRFSMQVLATPQKVKRSDPVTLTVTVRGTGNLRALRPPQLGRADGFRVYPPTSFEKIDIDGGRLRGRKGYEVLLQAQRVGQLTIPSLRLVYFDPEQRQYQVVQSKALKIEVVDDGQVPATEATAGTVDAAREMRARPLRLTPSAHSPAAAMSPTRLLGLAAALTLAVALVLLTDGLRRRRRRSQLGQHRQQLRQAHSRVENRAAVGDVDALAQAMEALIECTLQRPVKGLTRDGLDQALASGGCSDKLRQAVQDFVDASEAQRFAPPGLSTKANLSEQARALAGRLVDEGWRPSPERAS